MTDKTEILTAAAEEFERRAMSPQYGAIERSRILACGQWLRDMAEEEDVPPSPEDQARCEDAYQRVKAVRLQCLRAGMSGAPVPTGGDAETVGHMQCAKWHQQGKMRGT